MDHYRLDYETTSACDIRKWGAYRYASDPSTRILLFAISKNGSRPVLWRFDSPDCPESVKARDLLAEAIDEGAPISAFNAMFEYAISRYRLSADVGLPCPKVEQMRCTKAMALRAAIPASLANAAKFLKLDVDKDTKGLSLIHIFSDQTKLTTIRKGKESRKSHSPILENPIPWDWTVTVAGGQVTIRQAWEWFMDYCRQDVVVEGAVHAALAPFELSGTELEGFIFDLRMNDRGTPINRPALKHASKLIEDHQQRLTDEFRRLTGLSPSQTAKVLEWLRVEGYPGDNLQAATMEQWLGSDSLTEQGKRALEIRSQLSFAAVKKIPTMLGIACPDDRMRGLFQWHGAQRTGRWTSSGAQLQNAKKPTIPDPDSAYESICLGDDPDIFEILHGNPTEAVASCIRNFVQPHDGRRMLDADYAGIELRLAGELAGQKSMVDAFREGRDLYRELAAVIFSLPIDKINKDQRFVGKTASLGCIYMSGAETFHKTCAMFGQPISKQLAAKSVKTFREVNDQFPLVWKAYQNAAINAMHSPKQWFKATRFVKFCFMPGKPFPRLVMRLPSGRDIIHPLPEVTRTVKKHRDFETGEVREWETDQLSFYGQIQMSKQWGRINTYSGSLFQTSVQATARDIMLNGCLNAERQGFEIFSLIHDQALAEEGDPEAFGAALCQLPEWMPQDFPLAAEPALVDYYKKD